jgi:hypothetical protein
MEIGEANLVVDYGNDAALLSSGLITSEVLVAFLRTPYAKRWEAGELFCY